MVDQLVRGKGDGTRWCHAQQIGEHAAIEAAHTFFVPRVLDHREQRRMCGTEVRVVVAMCHLQSRAHEFVRIGCHGGNHLAGTAGHHQLRQRELFR